MNIFLKSRLKSVFRKWFYLLDRENLTWSSQITELHSTNLKLSFSFIDPYSFFGLVSFVLILQLILVSVHNLCVMCLNNVSIWLCIWLLLLHHLHLWLKSTTSFSFFSAPLFNSLHLHPPITFTMLENLSHFLSTKWDPSTTPGFILSLITFFFFFFVLTEFLFTRFFCGSETYEYYDLPFCAPG